MNLKKEVKIGLLVVASIAMFVFGYNFLKGRNIFNSRKVIYALYDNVNGLLESNPVFLSGFQVGQVLKTRLLPNRPGKILVELAINNNDFDIPSNSVARIVSVDALGAKAIELILGDSPVIIGHKDTIRAEIKYSFVDDVGSQIVVLKDKAEHLIESIDSVVVSVKEVLSEKTKKNLAKSFENITNITTSLDKTSASIENLLGSEKGKLTDIIKNIELITSNIQANNKSLSKVIKNFDAISDSIAKANLTSTINNVSKALAETALVLDKVNKGEGSAGLLFKDESLYKNLQSASLDLDKLLLDIKNNPKRYVHFSVFGKKDKPIEH